ncbi:CoA-dependent acyltransferase [Macrolepiota fuliginosa MF-IS2]|uniref:Dihydrolipoamide acetyltransferase component of pyruvate dehydrogenase complex n=1 Tax=Macrolepiota fuliginosa MF-IS2 TaxID=1400762 RepID=A0A9P5X599_9AGAR|nr:CoA-dependent acyltransferase [Macrolepiota fuliginosa MF-IS2]
MIYPLRRLVGRPSNAYRYYILRGLHSSLPSYAKKLEKFKLADIGEGITECEIIKWSVKPSGSVAAFDPLCEVQSDKASVEITSPFDGILKEILVKEGDVAKVGEGLCLIEVDEEAADDTSNVETVSAQPQESQSPAPLPSSSELPSTPISESGPQPVRRLHPLDPSYTPLAAGLPPAFKPSQQQLRGACDILAMPSVRHYARSKDVDLVLLVPGSGRDGRIEKTDVDAYLARSGPYAPAGATGAPTQQQDVVVELNRTRYNMWKAMEKSLEIPHFGYSVTLDVTSLQKILSSLNAGIPPRYLPSVSRKPEYITVNPSALYPAPGQDAVPESQQFNKLTFLPLLLKSLSLAMMEWPLFRSSITPDAQEKAKPMLTVRPSADIALGLSTPTGLYTPTLVGTNTHSVFDIQAKLKNLQHLGRQTPCGLTPKEMPRRGGTITVSNVGSIGKGVFASPVLVPGGGVAICAIGRAEWVIDVSEDHWNEASQTGTRRLKLPISWSADHRVVEGAELAAFVECWRAYVEDPTRMIGVLA